MSSGFGNPSGPEFQSGPGLSSHSPMNQPNYTPPPPWHGGPPPAPPKRGPGLVGWLAIAFAAVIALVIVASLVGGYMFLVTPPPVTSGPTIPGPTQQPTTAPPTESPTESPTGPGFTTGPSPTESTMQGPTQVPHTTGRLKGNGFSFATPPAWGKASDWGNRNDGKIVDGSDNDITVYILDANRGNAQQRCETELRVLQIWVGGTIGESKETRIAGKKAPGGVLTANEKTWAMRCVAYKGFIYNIASEAKAEDEKAVAAAFAAVLKSWKWE